MNVQADRIIELRANPARPAGQDGKAAAIRFPAPIGLRSSNAVSMASWSVEFRSALRAYRAGGRLVAPHLPAGIMATRNA